MAKRPPRRPAPSDPAPRSRRPNRPVRRFGSGPDDAPLSILYEDNHLLGVVKPAGMLMQGDRTGDTTLLEVCKRYVKRKYGKPGEVFLGLVHRIDRPVSGVALFARTSKAASRLAEAFRTRRVEKVYCAVVSGELDREAGELTGFIERDHMRSRLRTSAGPRAKEARLTYRRIAHHAGWSLLEVVPETGRHHQIRVQLAAIGHPVAGDLKYGAAAPLDDRTIALHAVRLRVPHPTRGEKIALSAPPPDTHPWTVFSEAISNHYR